MQSVVGKFCKCIDFLHAENKAKVVNQLCDLFVLQMSLPVGLMCFATAMCDFAYIMHIYVIPYMFILYVI